MADALRRLGAFAIIKRLITDGPLPVACMNILREGRNAI